MNAIYELAKCGRCGPLQLARPNKILRPEFVERCNHVAVTGDSATALGKEFYGDHCIYWLSARGGCYPIYIGKTINIWTRYSQHRQNYTEKPTCTVISLERAYEKDKVNQYELDYIEVLFLNEYTPRDNTLVPCIGGARDRYNLAKLYHEHPEAQEA